MGVRIDRSYNRMQAKRLWSQYLSAEPMRPLKTWCRVNGVYFGTLVNAVKTYLPLDFEAKKDLIGPIPVNTCHYCQRGFHPNAVTDKYCSAGCGRYASEARRKK